MQLAERSEIEVSLDDEATYWTGRPVWHATFGGWDLDCAYGSGGTPLDAIVDLLDQVEE